MIPFQIGLVADPGLGTAPGAAEAALRELRRLKDDMPNTRMLLHAAGDAEFLQPVMTTAMEMGYEAVTSVLAAAQDPHGETRPFEEMCRDALARANLLVAVCSDAAPRSARSAAWAARAFSEGNFSGAQPTASAPPDCGAAVAIFVDPETRSPVTVERLAPSPRVAGGRILSLTDAEAKAVFHRALGTLDAFNAECSEVDAAPEVAAAHLLPPAFPWQRDPLMVEWLTLQAKAETVSSRTSRTRRVYLLIVIGLSLVFTICSLAYGSLFAGSWPLLAGFAALTVAAFAFHRYSRQRIEEHHLGARVLAECLRVGITLRAEGLQTNLHGLVGEEGIYVFDWVGMMTKFLDQEARQPLESSLQKSFSEFRPPTALTPARHWIRSQLDYFIDGANRLGHHAKAARTSTRWVKLLVVLAVAGNLLTLALDISGDFFGVVGVAQITVRIMFFYWVLLAIAAMVSAHAQIMGHDAHHAEYSKSMIKFRTAYELLGSDQTDADKSLILALAAAATREIAIWLRVHRVRPLRILL